MIYDRTLTDVKNAIKIREEKVKTNQLLTESEIEILERGMFTLSSINRIQNKQLELKNLINEIGYYSTPIVVKNFAETDFFTKEDFERIIKNNAILKDAYFVLATTPLDATPKYNYADINKIELLLNDLEVVLEDMKSKFKRCGTFNCGG